MNTKKLTVFGHYNGDTGWTEIDVPENLFIGKESINVRVSYGENKPMDVVTKEEQNFLDTFNLKIKCGF